MHLTRYSMYKHIHNVFPEGIYGKVLGVSGVDNFKPIINDKKSIVKANFPKVDMQKLPYKSSSFDCVISDQVIEHLEDPWKAVKESHRVLKKGGIAIHATCLLMPIHPCPKDFWRFTPDALKLLCVDFSEIIDVGSWGNRAAVILPYIWNKLRFLPIPDDKFHPFNWLATWNDKEYPIMTWIIAKK